MGITRAREILHMSLASTRAQYGDISVALPSRFLQEIPAELIDWRQSPGEVTSQGGTQSRALNGRSSGAGYGSSGYSSRGGGSASTSYGSMTVSEAASGNMQSSLEAWRERKRNARQGQGEAFPNTIIGNVRDNGDLALSVGARIRHDEYGDGEVTRVTGEGTKSIAHVRFEQVGDKKLLIKIAPITKLYPSEVREVTPYQQS